MELIELIEEIDDEKILNRIKLVVLGIRRNKKRELSQHPFFGYLF